VGKFANDIGTTVCSEVQNAKSYITAEAQGESGGPDTGAQGDQIYVEIKCPKSGLSKRHRFNSHFLPM
jgi:hypothetical protein